MSEVTGVEELMGQKQLNEGMERMEAEIYFGQLEVRLHGNPSCDLKERKMHICTSFQDFGLYNKDGHMKCLGNMEVHWNACCEAGNLEFYAAFEPSQAMIMEKETVT